MCWVLRIQNRNALRAVIAVTPFRVGKSGGNAILVTGHMFAEGETTVAIGGKDCTEVEVSQAISLTCKAAAGL